MYSCAFSPTARTLLPSCAAGSPPSTARNRAAPREARGAERFGTWSRDVDVLEGLEIIVANRATNKKRNAVPNDLTRLEAMAEEATIDAYGESEQICGWACMFEDHVAVPFETTVLGEAVTVEAIEQRGDTRIVAICKRGRSRQAIDVLELPLPLPPPTGAEWIEAYRHWRKGW